jgi:hypothetical protein
MKGRSIAWLLLCGVFGVLEVAQSKPGPKASSSASANQPRTGKPPAPAVRFLAEVTVLHATRSKKPSPKPYIDPRIGPLPELEKEPFSLYDRYDLLDREKLPLLKDNPQSLTLPDGRIFRTALLEILAPNSVRFSASIDKPGGKDFLPLLEVKAKVGQAFMVAGQSYKGGILVLVVRLVE